MKKILSFSVLFISVAFCQAQSAPQGPSAEETAQWLRAHVELDSREFPEKITSNLMQVQTRHDRYDHTLAVSQAYAYQVTAARVVECRGVSCVLVLGGFKECDGNSCDANVDHVLLWPLGKATDDDAKRIMKAVLHWAPTGRSKNCE